MHISETVHTLWFTCDVFLSVPASALLALATGRTRSSADFSLIGGVGPSGVLSLGLSGHTSSHDFKWGSACGGGLNPSWS